MSKLTNLITASALTLTLSGCGESQEHSQDDPQQVVYQQEASSYYLDCLTEFLDGLKKDGVDCNFGYEVNENYLKCTSRTTHPNFNGTDFDPNVRVNRDYTIEVHFKEVVEVHVDERRSRDGINYLVCLETVGKDGEKSHSVEKFASHVQIIPSFANNKLCLTVKSQKDANKLIDIFDYILGESNYSTQPGNK